MRPADGQVDHDDQESWRKEATHLCTYEPNLYISIANLLPWACMTPAIIIHLEASLCLGMAFATLLHGISILQTWYYYTNQNDKWPIKSLVAAVMVCNTVHQAILIHIVYIYGISYWGDIKAGVTIVWGLVIHMLVAGLTTFLVQSFMIKRLWRLSNRNIFLLIFTSLIALSQFVSAASFSIVSVHHLTVAELIGLRRGAFAVITLAAVGDIIIAGALCFLLHRSRTGWERSDTMIRKIMIFTINTGLVTSLYAVASLIAFMVSPLTTLSVGLYFCIPRLYTNALLATLNARKMLRGNANDIHNIRADPTAETPSLAFGRDTKSR